MNKKTRIILWILLLTTIDQLIKLVIHAYCMDVRFEIIPSLVEFAPVFNSNYSYINVLLIKNLNIDIGFIPHIILYIVLQVIVTNIYFSFKIKLDNSFSWLLDTAIVFQVSALLCALIGNVIWDEGVLDYIYLKPLYVFDLKDVYSWVFVFLFLAYTIKKKDQLKTVNLDPKDVIEYIKKTKLFSKYK
ncbi:MAG TPA: signal peptidase II [Macellibacteroides fermentans]|uniref:signal peptidase II n=1 Tax=Macellibacteroides fermentans TaxID=879969 RepID=UPI002B8D6283|nr:signal peptidase II [Macellibacteroides fermentans]